MLKYFTSGLSKTFWPKFSLNIEPFVTADADGNYTIPDLATGQWMVTPRSGTVVFTPTTRTPTIVDADVTGVDFTAEMPPPPAPAGGGGGFDSDQSFKFRIGF